MKVVYIEGTIDHSIVFVSSSLSFRFCLFAIFSSFFFLRFSSFFRFSDLYMLDDFLDKIPPFLRVLHFECFVCKIDNNSSF